jgi:Zn-dependent metalloprotease
VITAPLIAAAALSGGAAAFKAAWPDASVISSGDGSRLTHVSQFEAGALGDSPERAAAAFLERYASAFGIGPRQKLVAIDHPVPGPAAVVHFERRIDGLPVFDGRVTVGLNAANAVMVMNSADVPPTVSGRARVSRKEAIRLAKAAIPKLVTSDVPRAERGWRAAGTTVRPVWRVDFTATRPRGDWRSYVDAETGKVLQRIDLRSSIPQPGIAPRKAAGLDE